MSEPGAAARPLEGALILLDCRWLGLGGAGRITEQLLRELREAPPPGRWRLWGRPEAVAPAAFSGAEIVASKTSPLALFGQRELTRVPACDVAVYPHQIRPLRPRRSVTFVLDTIPLRYGGGRATRTVKHAYFSLVARRTTRIVTISEHSRASIVRDLGVPAERIALAPPRVDAERGQRIVARRRELPQEDVLLYLGRFDRHKNLERLWEAYAQSEFARTGRLLLVGGWDGEVSSVRRALAAHGVAGVEARPTVDDDELDRLLATSRALVLPSLEEGYGLPAFEAAAAGLPVAVSRTGALAELPPEVAVTFDPTSIAEIREAIDRVTGRPASAGYVAPAPRLRGVVLDELERALREE